MVLLFAVLAVPSGVSGWGDPGGFFSNESVTERELAPGVVWTRAEGNRAGGSHVAHVVAVDLGTPDLEIRSLTGDRFVNTSTGQIYRRSRVSQMLADSGAVAAINTAFFDIRDTMAPGGLILQDGIVNREPHSARNTFVMTRDGRPHLMTNLGWSATVTRDGSERTVTGINRPAIASSQINAYLPPWHLNPSDATTFTEGRTVTEAFVEIEETDTASSPSDRTRITGTVRKVLVNGAQEPISEGHMVLSGVGAGGAFLGEMSSGDEVEVAWQLTGTPADVDWNDLGEAASGWHVLIRNGQRGTGTGDHWDGTHPRSAIGIDEDGARIVLVLVEGRMPGDADGMSLDTVIDFLEHLGAYNALEFDGGGSSALAGRLDGENQLLSRPSDGSERFVPAGLGVFVEIEEEEREEVIIDNRDPAPEMSRSGSWLVGDFGSPHGVDYHWASVTSSASPSATATYRPNVTIPGRYDVFTWWVHGSNRATSVPHRIAHAEGTQTVFVNQRNTGEAWRLLAEGIPFDSGSDGYVRIGNNASGGNVVIADAVRWLLVEPDTTRFAGWRAAYFDEEERADPSISGAEADPDGDGIPNLLEFALGLDPRTPDTGALPVPQVRPADGQGGEEYLTLEFSHPAGLSEIEYEVRLSSDLADWSESAVLVETADNGDGTVTRLYRDTRPYGEPDARFLRLQVHRSP